MRFGMREVSNMKAKLEVWKSNIKNREDHYFLNDNKRTYLFGYNPKFITKVQLKKILKILKINE
jgi:hypothetical protein